uniref:Jacalin-type lectin domain-containing protein n=1 Tax=Oryzias latipes TaxID=8090 RepID=A0A3B3IEY3_ORYLA
MSYLAPVLTIGGQGGRSFSFTGESNGATLKKLWVCVREWQVRGIKVWLTDGQVQEFGEPEGGFSQMEFQDGEQIKSLSLWGNGAGTRLGTIRIRTTLSQEFFPKMTKWNLKKEYPIDVGSGICLGVLGKGGDDIDILQDTAEDGRPGASVLRVMFVFVRKSCRIVRSAEKVIGCTLPSVQELYVSRTRRRAGRIAAYPSHPGHDLPELLPSGVVHQDQNLKTQEYLGFVFINIGRATVDLPYMAKVKITCYNGKTLKFNTSGIYKCVTYTNAKTIVTEKYFQT